MDKIKWLKDLHEAYLKEVPYASVLRTKTECLYYVSWLETRLYQIELKEIKKERELQTLYFCPVCNTDENIKDVTSMGTPFGTKEFLCVPCNKSFTVNEIVGIRY